MHVFPFLKQFLENLQRLSAILFVQFDVNIDFKMRELTETEQLKIGQGHVCFTFKTYYFILTQPVYVCRCICF